MATPLKLQVLELERESIIVRTSDGQKWRIPSACVHGSPAVGQTIRMIAMADQAVIADAALARAILNELLA